jgi:hypothetical protein
MKKLLVAFAALCSAGLLAGGVAANPDAGDVVNHGFECAIYDGNGNIIITTNSTLTQYQNKAVLRCTGDGAPAPNLTYYDFDSTELRCRMRRFGFSRTWVDKVGRNGNSQLTCTKLFSTVSSADSEETEGAGVE